MLFISRLSGFDICVVVFFKMFHNLKKYVINLHNSLHNYYLISTTKTMKVNVNMGWYQWCWIVLVCRWSAILP